MPAIATKHSVREHFEGCDPKVKATYAAIVSAAKTFGPVKESPKKTSIHLDRQSAFAGIATRKTALIVTLKSATDLENPRVSKHQHASPGRWYLDVRLEGPEQVDRELVGWLKKAYALAG
jgi:hypothetical protein